MLPARTNFFWVVLFLILSLSGCRSKVEKASDPVPEPVAQGNTRDQPAAADESAAIQVVEQAGGFVERDENKPGKPAIKVSFTAAKIDDTKLKALTALKQLKHLESLVIYQRDITDDGLMGISELTSLKHLTIMAIPTITSAGMKHLKGLTNLEELTLWGTEVGDPGLLQLAGLTKLKSLDLTGCTVTDAGLKTLKAHKQLKLLKLGGTAVTPDGIADLKKTLPQCTVEQ